MGDVSAPGGVSALGGCLPGESAQGGVVCLGVSALGGSVLGVSAQGVSTWGCVYPGRCLPGGCLPGGNICLLGVFWDTTPPCEQNE